MKDQAKTKEQLISELVELRQRISEFEAEDKWIEEALLSRTDELNERVKELNCLYGISHLREKQGISTEEMLQGVVDLIPPSWQYPENACARIILDGQEYKTENFTETIWKLTSDIIVHGDRIGVLEVGYLKEKPKSDEGPFLKEERSLVNAITERIGSFVQHKRAEEELKKHRDHLEKMVAERTAELTKTNEQLEREIIEREQMENALRESEEKYRELFENESDAVMIFDAASLQFEDANRATLDLYGYSKEEFLALNAEYISAEKEKTRIAIQKVKNEEPGSKHVPVRHFKKKDGTIFPGEISAGTFISGGRKKIIGAVRDITERKRAEEVLKKREAELEIRTNELEEVNSALRVLLKRRDEDKAELEEKVLSNVKELVLPYVERLKKGGLEAEQKAYLKILESNLKDIVSPFVHKLSSTYLALTPAEIHVASLVKEAKDTKTIAELLSMSPRTVESHRQSIRRKLGLQNKKANLKTHLLSM